MKQPLLPLLIAGSLATTACGGSSAPAHQANTPDSADDSQTLSLANVPDQCIERKGACMPPTDWAKKVCEDFYPDLALYMFRKGTPWTRLYMRTGLNAVNGWGPTLDEDLVSHEEVLVINHRLSKDWVVEGSDGTYDVLRWNGSCVTLDVNEVTPERPPRPKHSRVEWKALSERMQEALREDQRVLSTYRERRKECKGASIGRVTKRCEVLDGELGDVIAEYVRNQQDLPTPASHP
jgi:hypothetical protein